jgi:hypothetical protein
MVAKSQKAWVVEMIKDWAYRSWILVDFSMTRVLDGLLRLLEPL